jgi:cholest-4-en-3-one 26-monooxygenase
VNARDEDLLSPEYYGRHGYPHDRWEQLRNSDPVHHVSEWAGDPYWAITLHKDIMEISRNPQVFRNSPRFMMSATKGIPKEPFRIILDMDPPEHRAYRALASRSFTPKALTAIHAIIDSVCDEALQQAWTDDGEQTIDFVDRVSSRVPIWVIAQMLGTPREDWEMLYNWTNEAVGAADPDYQKGRSAEDTRRIAVEAMASYFASMIEDRRRNPQNDLTSTLAHARFDDGPVPDFELLNYMNTLLAAGNETTRNAITGGMLILADRPDLIRRLYDDPDLVNGFVEEVFRYVSPVIHMVRTPVHDVTIQGRKISAGCPIVLFYPSANRDEDVFESGHEFRADRAPNPHLAFGIGEHFCMGIHVARLELRALFSRLVQRIVQVELTGDVDRLTSNLVGGIKRMPVRCTPRHPA